MTYDELVFRIVIFGLVPAYVLLWLFVLFGYPSSPFYLCFKADEEVKVVKPQVAPPEDYWPDYRPRRVK